MIVDMMAYLLAELRMASSVRCTTQAAGIHREQTSERQRLSTQCFCIEGLAMNARENAENCAELAERAADAPSKRRFERLAASWKVMAETQDWLEGKIPASGQLAK
jgi:hypothetical protein